MKLKILVFIIMIIALSGIAYSANCGNGIKICECGDTLMADYDLPANLGPCTTQIPEYDNLEIGLAIGADDITLNGNGYTISSSFPVYYSVGIIALGKSGFQIVDLNLYDLNVGIYVEGGSGMIASDIGADHSGTGNGAITTYSHSNFQIINPSLTNYGNGVIISGGSANSVLDGDFFGISQQGISISSSNGNEIIGNTFSDNGLFDVYIGSGTGNTFYDNTFLGELENPVSAVAGNNFDDGISIGNFWEVYDEASEGCFDEEPPTNVCDDPFTDIDNVIDNYPKTFGGGIQEQVPEFSTIGILLALLTITIALGFLIVKKK